jgi:uncharacterized protein RhaS with RHS repeats
MVKTSGSSSSFDANGNLTNCNGQTLTWNHENRHPEGSRSVSGGGYASESYLYDPDGNRVKKVSNGVATYYFNQYYEIAGSVVSKYQYLGGQRVAMHSNASGSFAHYDLHSDHLGSTFLVTAQSGASASSEGYYAYGRTRAGAITQTENRLRINRGRKAKVQELEQDLALGNEFADIDAFGFADLYRLLANLLDLSFNRFDHHKL